MVALVSFEVGNYRLFPLPMYTTVPSEGSTYGFMPVFVRPTETGGIASIWAPSVSWNEAVKLTGTIRYYRFYSAFRGWSVIAKWSWRVNRTLLIDYNDLREDPWHSTIEVSGVVRRSLFYRFFGIGPDTSADDETSYERTTASLAGRWGLNLPGRLNVGVRGEVRGDTVGRNEVLPLPDAQDRFPDVPGYEGAGFGAAGLSLRFDTRRGGVHAQSGFAAELLGVIGHAFTGFDRFAQGTLHLRGIVPETSWLQGAARLLVTQQVGKDVPFYYRPMLGGEMLFRGFTEDRFVDDGAWEAEVEQRIRLVRVHIFDANIDARIDPFVAVGQVFPEPGEAFSRVRAAAGLGLRLWIGPNVLARVDLGYGGEGIKAYVVLGYPY